MAKETKLINVELLGRFKSNMDASISAITGNLTSLTTTDKDNLVEAINEVKTAADNAATSAQTADALARAAGSSAQTAASAAAAAQEAADNAAASAQTAASAAAAAQQTADSKVASVTGDGYVSATGDTAVTVSLDSSKIEAPTDPTTYSNTNLAEAGYVDEKVASVGTIQDKTITLKFIDSGGTSQEIESFTLNQSTDEAIELYGVATTQDIDNLFV